MWTAHHLNRGQILYKNIQNMELKILISFLCLREYDIQVFVQLLYNNKCLLIERNSPLYSYQTFPRSLQTLQRGFSEQICQKKLNG